MLRFVIKKNNNQTKTADLITFYSSNETDGLYRVKNRPNIAILDERKEWL